MSNDIRDIRGPIMMAVAAAWWPYLAAAALALAVIAVVVVLIRRRRSRPLSPAACALRDLEAAHTWLEQGDPQRFSSAVSDAVRGYVEVAFAIRAPRRTTDELLADLMSDDSAVAQHRTELGAFLDWCDLAKYARWSLSHEDMTRMLDSAGAFVRATAAPAPERASS
jgi:hypothetical protein